MSQNNVTEELAAIFHDPVLRREAARRNPEIFFNVYFPHYQTCPPADFHRSLFAIQADNIIKLAVVAAFRGSAKSTLLTLAYPLWAILGVQQRMFILLIGQNQNQARLFLRHIRDEVERNALLRRDFKLEPLGQLSAKENTLRIGGAVIVAVSRNESMRGIRNREFRPDLIIGDDIEDLAAVRSVESRQNTFDWLVGDITPAGTTDVKTVIIGNLLHQDSLLMRLRKQVKRMKDQAVYLEYPLLDDAGKCTWPGKYPTDESIELLKRQTGSDEAFLREYLLQIIPEGGRVIQPEWIQHYDELPADKSKCRFTAIGIDLAMSESDRADFTAMVPVHIFGTGEDMRLYVSSDIYHQHVDPEAAYKAAKHLSVTTGMRCKAELVVEDVAYQGSLISRLNTEGYYTTGFRPQEDKRARLNQIVYYIKRGIILFPKRGAEKLIEELTMFPNAKHDDLVDALTTVLLGLGDRLLKPQLSVDSMGMSGLYPGII